MTPKNDALVLDLFGGSATTAQAVLELNNEDGGSRSFVLATLNEPVASGTDAEVAGFAFVSDIALARIRKVITMQIGREEQGLRSFSLSKSNFAVIAEHSNFLFESTLVEGASEDSIAAEVLLKNGVTLDQPWDRIKLEGEPAVLSDGVCVVLARELNDEIVGAAKELKDAHTVIFLEDAFAGRDAIKANAVLGFKQANKTIKTV